jgi:3-deoxy-D-manno-octulosonate 8-phosphate phosphatase (KDO 8-P phosphatase)
MTAPIDATDSPSPLAPGARASSAEGDARLRAARVRLMVFDVDGVLTDGRLWFGPQGEAMKAFDVRDGLGIRLLVDAGIDTAILSARRSEIVAARARELRIVHVIQGADDKAKAFAQLLQATGHLAEHTGFIGDDWADLPVLRRVGFAATVADAAPEVQAIAHWVAPATGGRGAVRALAEFVLRSQQRFDAALAAYGGSAAPAAAPAASRGTGTGAAPVAGKAGHA